MTSKAITAADVKDVVVACADGGGVQLGCWMLFFIQTRSWSGANSRSIQCHKRKKPAQRSNNSMYELTGQQVQSK